MTSWKFTLVSFVCFAFFNRKDRANIFVTTEEMKYLTDLARDRGAYQFGKAGAGGGRPEQRPVLRKGGVSVPSWVESGVLWKKSR